MNALLVSEGLQTAKGPAGKAWTPYESTAAIERLQPRFGRSFTKMEAYTRHVMVCGPEQGSGRSSGASKFVAVNLHYIGSLPAVINGPVTGNIYRFSNLEPVQSVDPRDAVDLLADRQFRLAR